MSSLDRGSDIGAIAPGSDPPTVLIIDIDVGRRERLAFGLTAANLRVRIEESMAVGEREWCRNRCSAVLMGLQDIPFHGMDLLQRRQAAGDKTPVIVISTQCSGDERLHLLEAGADEFYAEPLDIEEIVARVRIFIRRQSNEGSFSRRIGHAVIRYASREIVVGGRHIRLTHKEFAVAACLLEAAGATVNRRAIEERVFASGESISSNALDVHVHNLRKKLGPASICTMRGGGYRVGSALMTQCA